MLSHTFFMRLWTGLLAAVVLPSIIFGTSSAWAEGSRSLYPNTYPVGGAELISIFSLESSTLAG